MLVNLAVVTNIIPSILSMAAWSLFRKWRRCRTTGAHRHIIAGIGALYNFYALYSSG